MRRTRGREGDARVLVVEDDPDLSRLMATHLASEGYDVARASEAAAALELVGAGCVDVVVLDLMLPRISGDGLLVRLREREGTRDLPVIVVSAKDAVWTRVDLLRLGADDYLTKPFDLDELTARIEALLRRSRSADDGPRVLRHGDLVLDPAARRARLADRDVPLTPAELTVLEVLMSAPGRVASKGALARAVGDAGEGAPCIAGTAGTTGVKTHVSHLRAKLRALDPDVEHIDTVWGLGYRMAPL
ncbi:response regulator transcription factor [Actinomyces massiliensis]|jgi:two component transcriptional regulator, winged helix family|uniref:Response regulator receiver domain protein n=1 Tax=Actinomyces massiliensis F0489 TaxID=1125718 RepID=J0MU86_9ACTO|nr:response regulator transcription factor [Actinomyces massiliensis]EJF37874.1 response regulator receiver domain protein [Actinomyces massiliensis F0489]WLD72076.1 response regulator transcription factor [Actinomyces massiliensis]